MENQTPVQPHGKGVKAIAAVLSLCAIVVGGYFLYSSNSNLLRGSVDGAGDMCPNIDGVQDNVPPKMTLSDGECVLPPALIEVPVTDVCLNISDTQAVVPDGMEVVEGGCYTPADPKNPRNVAAVQHAAELAGRAQACNAPENNPRTMWLNDECVPFVEAAEKVVEEVEAVPAKKIGALAASAAVCSTQGMLYSGGDTCQAIGSVTKSVCKQIVQKYNLGVTCENAKDDVVDLPLADEEEPVVSNVVNYYYGSSGRQERINELENELLAMREQQAAQAAAAAKAATPAAPAAQAQEVAVAQPVAQEVAADALHGAAKKKKLNAADAQAIERAFAESNTEAVKASSPIVRVKAASQTINGNSMRGDTGPEVMLYPSLIAIANGAYFMLRKKRK